MILLPGGYNLSITGWIVAHDAKIMDKLAALTAFVRVVEAQGFAPAARRLGLATSSLTRQVDALESELRAPLLNRTTRRVTPTEAGRLYYARAVRLLDDLAAADDEISGHVAPYGTLNISAPVAFGRRYLAPILPEFVRQCPAMTLDVSLSDTVVDLAAADIDVAIRIGPVGNTSLVARQLVPQRRVFCAAPSYLAERGVPAAPGDLSAHDCLTLAHGDSRRSWRFDGPGGPVEVEVAGPLRSDNSELLLTAALAGAGVILLPDWLVTEDLRAGRLTELLRDFTAEQTQSEGEIRAVWLANRRGSLKVSAFVSFVSSKLQATREG